MAAYPVVVNLDGRACVVIGGGTVAEAKVRGLLEAGASVTVISPSLTDGLVALLRAGGLIHSPRSYRDGDLRGFTLAFAATGDASVNAAVAAEGRRRRVWVNAADDPAHCDFMLPSVLRRGDLAIAVSTGGRSPAVARVVRDELEDLVGADYGSLLAVASDVRRALRDERVRPSVTAWLDALRDPEIRDLIRRENPADARRRLRTRLGAA